MPLTPGTSIQTDLDLHVWHKGTCLSEDWQAGGLAISDDTETFAIAGDFLALTLEMDINNMDEIHVFMDSITAIRQSMDPSIHSTQECALEILFLITPWVEQGNKWIYFHHVSNSEDFMFMPHHLVHNLALFTKIEAGFSLLLTLLLLIRSKSPIMYLRTGEIFSMTLSTLVNIFSIQGGWQIDMNTTELNI